MFKTTDAKKKRRVQKPKIDESTRKYSRALRAIAEHIGHLVDAFDPADLDSLHTLEDLLRKYSEALIPWATKTASSMLADVNGRDFAMWQQLSQEMGFQLQYDIANTDLGVMMRQLLREQVELITSMPVEAGERVHELTLKGLETSRRAEEIAKDIEASGEVSKSKAKLIARTEVGRTSTLLSQARAAGAGFTHYIWRTAGDSTVREGHKDMEGKVCEWAKPPAVNENGRIMYHHPGCIWNCRCWPETIVNI